MPRITQMTEITEYDGTTGEVTAQTQTKTVSVGAEPDYIKLYLQDILYLSDMPTQYSAALMSLLKRTSYAGDEYGMCVVLVPMVKDAICKELGYQKRQSLDNVLQKLVKGEILYRVGRGMYRLNPYLFGRGTWADISKIRMEISYHPGGRTFQTTIDHKAQQAAERKASKAAHRSPQEEPEQPLPGQTTLEDVTGPTEATEAAQEAKAS